MRSPRTPQAWVVMHNARTPSAGRGAESPRYLRGGRLGSARLEATGESLPKQRAPSPLLGSGGSITAAPVDGALGSWLVYLNLLFKTGVSHVAILASSFLVGLLCISPHVSTMPFSMAQLVLQTTEKEGCRSGAGSFRLQHCGQEAPTPASPAPR